MLRLESLREMRPTIERSVDHMSIVVSGRFKDVDTQIGAQREYIIARLETVSLVSDERFTAIATQFAERDTRIGQAEIERQKSLDAALAAAKEAVSEQNKANEAARAEQNRASSLAIEKSELATKERLDALSLLMTTSVKGLEDKIRSVETRLDRGEGWRSGAVETVDTRRKDRAEGMSSLGAALVGFSLFVSVASIITAIVLNH